MDLAGKYLVVWLSPEAIETFLGVLEPSQDGSHDIGRGLRRCFASGVATGRTADSAARTTTAAATRVRISNGIRAPLYAASTWNH
jgi:hypothetical protein